MGIKRIIDMSYQPAPNVRVTNSKEINDIMRGLKKSYPITKGDIPDKSKEPGRFDSFMRSDFDSREIYNSNYFKRWYMYKELFEEIEIRRIVGIPISYRPARFRTLADLEGI